MKRALLALLLLLGVFSLNAQKMKMEITLNNGEVKTGIYKIRSHSAITQLPVKIKFISKTSKEKISIDKVKSVIVYPKESAPEEYFVITTRKKMKDKKGTKKLAKLVYQGKHISLYTVEVEISQNMGGPNDMHMHSFEYTSEEYFALKTKDKIAFNIGYIYGAAERGIKKRVREYFTDCAKLVEKVNNKSIPKKETMKIIEFYENNCGG